MPAEAPVKVTWNFVDVSSVVPSSLDLCDVVRLSTVRLAQVGHTGGPWW